MEETPQNFFGKRSGAVASVLGPKPNGPWVETRLRYACTHSGLASPLPRSLLHIAQPVFAGTCAIFTAMSGGKKKPKQQGRKEQSEGNRRKKEGQRRKRNQISEKKQTDTQQNERKRNKKRQKTRKKGQNEGKRSKRNESRTEGKETGTKRNKATEKA